MENTIEKLQKKVNRLEKNLHESKVQYKNVVNSLFVGIAIHVNNKIVFANRALIDLTGGNSETDFLGKNILEFVHPKDRVKVTEAVTKAFSKPDFTQNEVSNVIEGRLIKTDGSEIIAEFSAILINYYGKPALMVMINDITERKQAREVLKHRLITLTQPIGEVEKLKLTDIIDVDILQELQDGFAESYNVAALIYDNKGNPVTKPSNYSDFCSLIRSTEKGMQRCKKSKVNISNLIAGGSPVTDKCTVFKEVFEGATPIFLGDRYVGTWGIGQKLNKKIPEEKLRNFAKEIDIDEDEFVAAAGKLKIGTKEQFKQAVSFLNIIAKDVALLGLQNIQQAREISNRKLAEEAMRESEEKYKKLYSIIRLMSDNLPDLIWTKDIEGKYLFVNKACSEILFNTRDTDEPIGKTDMYFADRIKESCPENSDYHTFGKTCTDSDLAVLSTKKPLRFDEFGNVKGEFLFLDVYKAPFYDRNDEIIGTVGCARIVTKERQMEKELRESEQKFRDLANLLPQIVYEIDVSGNLTFVNKQAFDSFGYSQEEFEKRINVLQTLIPEDRDRAKENIQNVLNRKKVENFEYTALRKDRSTFPILIYSSAIIKNNKLVGLRGIIVDITERKQAEEQLAAQNKEYALLNEEFKLQNQELILALGKAEESDRLKTEFINNMSHEIRTPMNGILGFSELLNISDLSDKKQEYYIRLIQNSSNQLLQIIDDILEISKLGTKQVKAQNKNVCLNDLLLELFSIFDIKAKENETPLYMRKGLSDKESTIYTDEDKLNKILSKLLENALKFTNVGFVEFGYQLIKSNIEIYVKDTGIGINIDKQETIFERFSQEEKEISRKVGGLGLGLSIAKENAELIGGKITLKSEKGKGTTFFITIPYKPVNSYIEKSNLYNEKEKIMKKQDKYTILIVEDEEVNYLYIETLLKDIIEIQCNIIHSKNGKEAVDLCETNSEIDFVLMDIKMPVMNGHEATKLIKEFRPDLSIVAQTAYSTKEDKGKAISAGCDDFISKPISEETLKKIINKYLIKNN